MARFTIPIIALMAASSAIAGSSIPKLIVVTKPLSEVSRTLNLSNVVVHPAPSTTAAKAEGEGPSLAKRDGIRCFVPGPSGSGHLEDCLLVCNHFLYNPIDTVTLNPVEIVTWAYATCQFGLANLDPCRSRTFQLGRLTSICQGMLGQCVQWGEDGFYDGRPEDTFAAALTGDDAAPPYDQRPC